MMGKDDGINKINIGNTGIPGYDGIGLAELKRTNLSHLTIRVVVVVVTIPVAMQNYIY